MQVRLPKISKFIARFLTIFDSAQSVHGPSRRVSCRLAAGIAFAPFLFSLVTLKRGYHHIDRSLAFAWMVLYLVMASAWISDRYTNRVELAPDPKAILLPEKQILFSGASPTNPNLPSVLLKTAHFDKCGVLYLALAEASSRAGDAVGYKASLQYSQTFRDVAIKLLRMTGISNDEAQVYLRDEVESDPQLSRDVAKVVANRNELDSVFGPVVAGCLFSLRNAGGDPSLAEILKDMRIVKLGGYVSEP